MLSKRLYQLMLLAYPRDFRLEFGSEMTQVFRDCQREIQSGGLVTALQFWLRIILDVLRTAGVERWETLGRGRKIMKRTDVTGLAICVAIIAGAFFLLGYGRKHEVASILLFGHALDAIVAAGVIGNLVVLLLVKMKHLSQFRTALWSLLIVNGALLIVGALIGNAVDPTFNFARLFVGYAVSFGFWLGIHWIWSRTNTSTEMVV